MDEGRVKNQYGRKTTLAPGAAVEALRGEKARARELLTGLLKTPISETQLYWVWMSATGDSTFKERHLLPATASNWTPRMLPPNVV